MDIHDGAGDVRLVVGFHSATWNSFTYAIRSGNFLQPLHSHLRYLKRDA